MPEPSGTPLTRDELVRFLRARAQREPNQERKTVLLDVMGALNRTEYARMPAREAVDRLTERQWTLEARKTQSQLFQLRQVFNQLDEIQDRPDSARQYIEATARLQSTDRDSASRPPVSSGQVSGQALAAEVSRAATGSVVVQTSHSGGIPVRYRSGEATASHGGGFHDLGDGADDPFAASRPTDQGQIVDKVAEAWRGAGRDMYEGVAFVPAEMRTQEAEQYVAKRRMFGQDEMGTRMVSKVGPMTVDGPRGKEPGVQFGYTFDPNQRGAGGSDGLPGYLDPASGRLGNGLTVRAVLPQSVAERLQQAIERDPTVARAVAEQLVRQNGGVQLSDWEGQGGRPPMRPPWAQVPASQPIHLVTNGPGQSPVVRTIPQVANQQTNRHDGQQLAGQIDKFSSSGQTGQRSTSGSRTSGAGSRDYQTANGWSLDGMRLNRSRSREQ